MTGDDREQMDRDGALRSVWARDEKVAGDERVRGETENDAVDDRLVGPVAGVDAAEAESRCWSAVLCTSEAEGCADARASMRLKMSSLRAASEEERRGGVDNEEEEDEDEEDDRVVDEEGERGWRSDVKNSMAGGEELRH